MADLDETKPLPWVPGEGPFGIKGVAYRGHLTYIAEHVPGGMTAVLAGLRDRRIATFFDQPFLAGTFYDIGPMVIAGHVCARQLRRTFYDFLRLRSRYQAQKDLSGVYRLLLKLASPAMVLPRLPALQSQYLDFVDDGRAELVGKGRAQLTSSLPAMLSDWFTIVNESFIEVALTASGASSVICRSSTQPGAPLEGYPGVKYVCEVSWQS